ncbi:MAG: AbrB/MazE/SpoVT family DNA-binding domain-containing protein [Candidatus Atribacteria bacterium]|nr:AbrB/MazE/SpoVT family DNA-binding domain-containing protein [Candidatus Atribacteria bacterium]
MFARVSKKGQITIPAEVRKLLNLHPGSRVQFVAEKETARILPIEGGIETFKGAVQVTEPQDFQAARHQAMEERSSEKDTRSRR